MQYHCDESWIMSAGLEEQARKSEPFFGGNAPHPRPFDMRCFFLTDAIINTPQSTTLNEKFQSASGPPRHAQVTTCRVSDEY